MGHRAEHEGQHDAEEESANNPWVHDGNVIEGRDVLERRSVGRNQVDIGNCSVGSIKGHLDIERAIKRIPCGFDREVGVASELSANSLGTSIEVSIRAPPAAVP